MNREDLKSIKFIVEKGEQNSLSSFQSGAKIDKSGEEIKEILKSELVSNLLKKNSLNNRIKELSSEINMIKSVLDNIENKSYQLNTEFATKLGL